MLGWIEGPERMLILQRVEKIQHRWDRIQQRRVERQDLSCHLLMDRSGAVVNIDLEILLEQFDHRQVRRCSAVGNGTCLDNQPVRCMLRMNEFMHQPRLAHACLANDRHHLTATAASKLLGAAELLQLDVATDKARQTSPKSGLKPSSRGAGACHLVNWQRTRQPLNRYRPEGPDGDVTFRKLESF